MDIRVGSVVRFPSGSAPSGYRYGKVIERTATRVRVAYKFYDGSDAAPKWVRIVDVFANR